MKNFAIMLTIVAIAIGLYFTFRTPEMGMEDLMSGQDTSAGMKMEDGVMPSSGKKMAFSSFLKQGGSYKCMVHQSVGGTDTVGTVFVDNQKVRGEFSVKTQGMDINTTFVAIDGYTYTWSSMMPKMGYKSKMIMTGEATPASMSGSYSFNADQIGDYDCQGWTADASKFALPAGITFTDMSAKME